MSTNQENDRDKFNAEVLKIKALIEDYKRAKEELNKATIKLESLYNQTTDEADFSLDSLYLAEDFQFETCITAVCIYQDMVSLFNRLEESDENKFAIRLLEKQILDLEHIESEFYFDYKPNLNSTDKRGGGNDDINH